MDRINEVSGRVGVGASEIDGFLFWIKSVELSHLPVSFRELGDQFAVHVVKIEMIPPITVTLPDKVRILSKEISSGGWFNVLIIPFFNQHFEFLAGFDIVLDQ